MEWKDVITIVIVALSSSLPLLLVAVAFGLISLGVLWAIVSPWIPLIAMTLFGKFIYDTVKEEYPQYAIIILIAFLLIGLVLTFTVGFGWGVQEGPEVW